MSQQPVLTDSEWALVAELLVRERQELPSEIRHTRTSSLRDGLRQRLETVDRLLEKLEGVAPRARRMSA